MKKKITWEQLARFFAGELHGDNEKKMEAWIKSDPKREEHIKKLHKIWKESGVPPYELNVDEAWNNLSDKIDKIDNDVDQLSRTLSATEMNTGTSGSTVNDKQIKRHGAGLRRWLMAAATITIMITAGLLAHYYSADIIDEPVVEIENRVFETKVGERASYVLVDGSRVVLHADSRLEIPSDYNTENRELYLEGMAFFETVHNPDKAFIVHSQDTYTKVLGTHFLVQAWPDLIRNVEVIVAQGKVLFGDSIADRNGDTKEAFITQNQRAVLTGNDSPVVSDINDLEWYLGWTEGKLVFDNRPLNEVIPRLERWYAISIEIEDERVGEKRITAEIDYSQSMSEVLEGIALTLDLEIEKEGRNVIFMNNSVDSY